MKVLHLLTNYLAIAKSQLLYNASIHICHTHLYNWRAPSCYLCTIVLKTTLKVKVMAYTLHSGILVLLGWLYDVCFICKVMSTNNTDLGKISTPSNPACQPFFTHAHRLHTVQLKGNLTHTDRAHTIYWLESRWFFQPVLAITRTKTWQN